MMDIPWEFEDVFRGVDLTEDEIRTLNWVTGWEHRTVENLRSAIQKAQATALSTLQAEKEKLMVRNTKLEDTIRSQRNGLQELRAELENYRKGHCAEGGCAAEKDRDRVIAENEKLRAELEYEKEHANAYYEECGQWEAENEKLRAELNDLKEKWDKYQPREHWETLNELCENLHDELEQVKAALRREQDG